ncbi:MAG: alpha/beta hydrolase fold domain-containing protein [Draconibacterium sp.]
MKKHFFYFSTFILLAATLFSCVQQEGQKKSPANNLLDSEYKTITVTDNIRYRDGDSQSWVLDLAMPANFGKKLRPALVIVHGGGWRSGSKDADVYQKMMIDYAGMGYVVINVNYRLTGEAAFPACIEDVKCAVRWLRAHAGEFSVDPNKIGSFGHSAGAHLSLMLAMCPDSANLEGDGGWTEFSSRVNVAVGASTPTALERNNIDTNPVYWPVGYIAADQPPILLIHGTDDELVPVIGTDAFVQKMKDVGANIQYLRVDSVGHGVAYRLKLGVTEPVIRDFLAKYLQP